MKIIIKKSLDCGTYRSYLVYRDGKLTDVTMTWHKFGDGSGEYTIKHRAFLGTTTKSFEHMTGVRAYLKTIG